MSAIYCAIIRLLMRLSVTTLVTTHVVVPESPNRLSVKQHGHSYSYTLLRNMDEASVQRSVTRPPALLELGAGGKDVRSAKQVAADDASSDKRNGDAAHK